MKIYISGAGGMLGEAFYENFKNEYQLKCTDIDVNESWLSYLDFRDFKDYQKSVYDFKPDFLFHLGAFTDLEYCEENIEDTYQTNTKSVEHAVAIANSLKIPILFISTAGIFDGEKEFYDESDNPNPIGHYAKSKFQAEKYVQKNSSDFLICRAGWMMGGGPKKDKKFIQKIMRQLNEGKKELFIVDDKLGTPTYTHDFAKNVKLLIDKKQKGLFNMVCSGLTSRYEVAKDLISLLGLEENIKIKKVNSDFFSEKYFAERPDCERLINRRLDELNINIMRNWKDSLKDYINSYYLNYITK